MINKTLYAREMKNSVKLLFILAAVMALYIGIIIYMYEPEMMALLDSYVDAMPEMMAAVGMTAGATDLLGFMISYLYGFILLVFPMIFCIPARRQTPRQIHNKRRHELSFGSASQPSAHRHHADRCAHKRHLSAHSFRNRA